MIKKLQKQIRDKEARQSELFKLKEPIDKELKSLYEDITNLNNKLTKAKLKQEMSFEEKFEHTLSENGVYELVFDDNLIKLVVWRYHRESMIKEWDNLRDALLYCQEYHYYESSLDDDNDWY